MLTALYVATALVVLAFVAIVSAAIARMVRYWRSENASMARWQVEYPRECARLERMKRRVR